MKPNEKSSEEASSQRPKRSTCQKNIGGSNGLLWREETDLKRALYASLQETRRRNFDDDDEEEDVEVDVEEELKAPSTEAISKEQDEILKKAKVHAQRKFAQGSNPNSPVPTPQKAPFNNNSTKELLPYRRPKTEDFLTFLCLRGTSILPPSLNFLNCCSKSDTSSECRSLSPDLELRDNSNQKDTSSKTTEPRDRNSARHEVLANGISRKLALVKASSKRQHEVSYAVKKTVSKTQKEVNTGRKRKPQQNDQSDVEFTPSNSMHSKSSRNSRTRSSTYHKLREKYKKQRLAADKKKSLPPSTAKTSSAKVSETRSQSSSRTTKRAVSQDSRTKTKEKSVSPVFNKLKFTPKDKKLAIEKRKSLRSAHPPKRLVNRHAQGMIRRAKLVPPVVDVDSDSSEPEIISPTAVKRSQQSGKHGPTGRLRSREITNEKSYLTPRQLLLRKHMQNRLKAKKSVLSTKDIKSKAIVRKSSRQGVLKRIVKRGLASKTMALRKDLQNKRVTRSAKQQIQDMLWANPEKRSKSSRIDKKRYSSDDQIPPKKPKLTIQNGLENKQFKSEGKEVKKKVLEAGVSNKQVSASKTVKRLADGIMNTRRPKPSGKDTKSDSSSCKTKAEMTFKVNSSNENKVKSPVDFKSSKSVNNKVVESKANKNAEVKPKKISEKTNKPPENNGNKSDEDKSKKSGLEKNKKDNQAITGNKLPSKAIVPTDSDHKGPSHNLHHRISHESEQNMKKETNDAEFRSSTSKSNFDANFKSSSSFVAKETSVQNNLNLQKIDKNHDKDISQLISLNVECEESAFVTSKPSCSGVSQEENRKLSLEKTTKVESKPVLVSGNDNIKKHNDKKYIKNMSFKEEKMCSNVQNNVSDKVASLHKKELITKTENDRVKLEFSDRNKTSNKEALKKVLNKEICVDSTVHGALTQKNNIFKETKANNKTSVEKSKQTDKHLDKEVKKSKDKVENKKINSDFMDNFSKLSAKKDLKRLKENTKEHCNLPVVSSPDVKIISPSKEVLKANIPSSSNDSSVKISNVTVDSETDDDSDNDIPLDIYLKMKCNTPKSETPFTGSKTLAGTSSNIDVSGLKASKTKKESKKEIEHSKHKKDKSHDKFVKKDDKLNRRDSEKSLAKFLKKERSKSSRKEEKLKHKRDGSSSSKSSKRVEKDGSKLKGKGFDNSSCSLEKKLDSEGKKEKSNKKESSKISRSNSYDETKSPKKKKRYDDDIKQIEEIKNIISKSSIINEISGFKEFKRRLSSDKDKELKKRLKLKKRKKLALLKEKKVSKKLSSKLLRKYSKKKGLKKKNKLKKKGLKKEMKSSSSNDKVHSKTKGKKHKTKSDHHKKSIAEKSKKLNAGVSIDKVNKGLTSELPKGSIIPNKEAKSEIKSINAQTCTSDIISPANCIIEPTQVPVPVKTVTVSQGMTTDSNDSEIETVDLTDSYEEIYPTGAVLLATRDSISKVPLNFSQDMQPRYMADAATNTCEEDIDDTLNEFTDGLKSEEMSVGTQTMTPLNSPSPTVETRSIVPNVTSVSSSTNSQKYPNSNLTVPANPLIVPMPFVNATVQMKPTVKDSATNHSVRPEVPKKLNSSCITLSIPSVIPIRPKVSSCAINHIPVATTPLRPNLLTCTKSIVLPVAAVKGNMSMRVSNPVTIPIIASPKKTVSVNGPILSVPSLGRCILPNNSTASIKPAGYIANPIPSVSHMKPKPTLSNCNIITSITSIKPKVPSSINSPVVQAMKAKLPSDSTSMAESKPNVSSSCINTSVTEVKPKVASSSINTSVAEVKPKVESSSINTYVAEVKPKVASNNSSASVAEAKHIVASSSASLPVSPGQSKAAISVSSDNSILSTTPNKATVSIPSSLHNSTVTPKANYQNNCNSNPGLAVTTEQQSGIIDSSPAKPKLPNSVDKCSSSSSSPKVKKRSAKKAKLSTNYSLPKLEPFPVDAARLVSAPIFHPKEEEFNDPLEYINRIRPEAEQYGICKIVPPPSFKPECKVNDDMRFTAHNQYLHKMLDRWGPNVQHTTCIKKHLKTQKVKLEQPPLIGGIELDVSKFYHTVQQLGGLQQVIEKKKWQRVADALHVPKTAQDRVTKLYDAYCRYLVSYDTLPLEEKQKIEEEVIAEHKRRVELRSNAANESEKEDEDTTDEENTDCVTKGRSMSLSNFFRIARNTISMWYKNEPSPEEVEHEYWKLVTERQQHMVVHAGNIDSSVTQSGFPTTRSTFAKHPWNLKVLTNNSRSILKSMGPLSGITIPTLHVGMLFTTGCWYRDPHSFPWIEYLHTGASKIWYGIPANGCDRFRNSMKKIMPDYCTDKPLWLSSDTAMVPPDLLVKHGASLSRTIQKSGQFVVIFPGSFTSTICCGYCVSESVYFAPTSWLDLAVKAFQDIRNSCESPAFSLERLLISIGNDPKPQLKIHLKTLEKILPMIENIRQKEMQMRAQLNELGLKQFERLPLSCPKDKKKRIKTKEVELEQECDECRMPCYVSMVVCPQEESVYCLPHALEQIQKKNFKLCKLKYTYNEYDLNELIKRISDLVSQLPNHDAKKKSPKKIVSPGSQTPEK